MDGWENEWMWYMITLLKNYYYPMDLSQGTMKTYHLDRKLQNQPVSSFSSQNIFPNKNDEMPHNSAFALLLNSHTKCRSRWELAGPSGPHLWVAVKANETLKTQDLEFIAAHSLKCSCTCLRPIYNADGKKTCWPFGPFTQPFLHPENKVDSSFTVAKKMPLWLTREIIPLQWVNCTSAFEMGSSRWAGI